MHALLESRLVSDIGNGSVEFGIGILNNIIITLVFSLLVRGGRETTAPELSSRATISLGFTNCKYLSVSDER